MGAADTTYQVRTFFVVEDRGASSAIRNIDKSARTAHASTSMLDRSLGLLGAALVGRAGFGLAKRAFIDFNNEVEKTQIGLSGIIQMNLGGTFEEARDAGRALFLQFQDDAKKSIGTTQEFAEMARNISSNIFQAGGNMKDLREITRGAITAMTALGDEGTGTLDIQQALGKGVEIKDRFMVKMLAGAKMSKEEFNALSKPQRLEKLKTLFNQQSVKDMAKAYETSFAGVTSTLKDNLQIAFGEVGKPLMKEITAEFARWNAWIEKNPDKIAKFSRDFKNALASGYDAVRSIAKALLDNKELIMALVAMKGLGAVGGAAGGMFGFGEFGKGLTGAEAGLGSFTSGLLKAATGVSALYLAATAFAGWVDRRQDAQIKARSEFAFAKDSVGRLAAGTASMQAIALAKQLGLLKGVNLGEMGSKMMGANRADVTALALKAADIGAVREGKFLPEVAKGALAAGGMKIMSPDELARTKSDLASWQGTLGSMMPDYWKNDLSAKISQHEQGLALLDAMASAVGGRQALPGVGGDAAKVAEMMEKHGKVKTPVKVDVKIDVTTNDPDRFVMDVNSILEDAITNPNSSRHAPRGG